MLARPDASQEDRYRPLREAQWRGGKQTTLSAAAASVADGQMVALGGMTLYRRPVAVAVELIRQGRRDLTLLDYTGSYEGDIMIGAGCVACVRSCYFGMDVLGLAPMHRSAIEGGSLRVIEETEATVAFGLRAARAHVDFTPARILAQTDITEVRPDLHSVASPYTGQEYVAVPALVPDVAFVHALMCDDAGNAVLGSEYSLDVDLAAAARYTVISAERVVPRSEIEAHGADIVAGWVDAVVEAPRGAYPTSCQPEYDVDLLFLAAYVDACRAGEFSGFLRDSVMEPA